MSTGKKIGIIMTVIVIVVVGVLGYQLLQIRNTDSSETTLKQVETQVIKNTKTEIVLSGQVQTKETKSAIYDYTTYGKLLETKVTLGQHVNEGDIIVESGKKDYKAPFNGYITELNVQLAYDEAKKAYDDNKMVEKPTILYTIVSDDYYIETTLTEYEVNRLPEHKIIKYAIRAKDINTYYESSIRLLSALPEAASAATAQTKTSNDIAKYPLTLNMDGGKEYARVGNHVTIRITDGNAPKVILPKSAILNETVDGKETYSVYVLSTATTGQQTVIKRKITGQFIDSGFEVESGVNDEEEIVINDVNNLTDGEKVFKATVETTTTSA